MSPETPQNLYYVTHFKTMQQNTHVILLASIKPEGLYTDAHTIEK